MKPPLLVGRSPRDRRHSAAMGSVGWKPEKLHMKDAKEG